MTGWPDGVLMLGQLHHPGARTKGIADLSNAERRRLQQALLAGEIGVARLSGWDERRKRTLIQTSITQWYPGAVSVFSAPVVIGAPPPPASERAKAQQMYGNGTIDFDGPDRLPSGTAATRIKQKRTVKATAEDPIVISSSDDGAAHIIPAKKKSEAADDSAARIIPAKKKLDAAQRTKAAVKGKRKAIVVLDSDDEEVRSTDDDGGSVIDVDTNREEDYEEAGDSRKRKARNPPSSRLLKKPTPSVEPTKSKKGKEHKRPIKTAKKQKYKSAEYVDVSDSDLSMRTVKGIDHVNESDIH